MFATGWCLCRRSHCEYVERNRTAMPLATAAQVLLRDIPVGVASLPPLGLTLEVAASEDQVKFAAIRPDDIQPIGGMSERVVRAIKSKQDL